MHESMVKLEGFLEEYEHETHRSHGRGDDVIVMRPPWNRVLLSL